MNSMRVCLITPPSIFLLDERVFMTLGILRVAAALEGAGHEVEMLDLSGIENYEEVIRLHAKTSKADIYGLTATTPQMPAAFRVTQALRKAKPDVRIMLGGPHITLINAAYKGELTRKAPGRAAKAMEKMLATYDVLVPGDGEEAVFEALKPDAPKIVDGDDPKTALFLTNKKLNELPFPARHLVDANSYHYSIDNVPAMSLIDHLRIDVQLVVVEHEAFRSVGVVEVRDLLDDVFGAAGAHAPQHRRLAAAAEAARERAAELGDEAHRGHIVD